MKEKEINELTEMLRKNQVKENERKKKQHRKELISNIIWILACLSVICILINIVGIQTKKDVQKCLKNGYSENYCLRSSY